MQSRANDPELFYFDNYISESLCNMFSASLQIHAEQQIACHVMYVHKIQVQITKEIVRIYLLPSLPVA